MRENIFWYDASKACAEFFIALGNAFNPFALRKRPRYATDEEAITADWQRVGEDFCHPMDLVRRRKPLS